MNEEGAKGGGRTSGLRSRIWIVQFLLEPYYRAAKVQIARAIDALD